jgi:threonine dehydratase
LKTGERFVREPNARDLASAKEIVSRYLSPTILMPSPALGDRVMLKLETFQPTGSFKVRGGLAAVANAVASNPTGRVVTASAGNHGLGVAYAAKALGAGATIVIFENASPAKRKALESFSTPLKGSSGIEIVVHGANYDEAEAYAISLASEGSRFVSAYNDPDVIAGQGTITLELFDQVRDLGSVIAPVGGGGLLAGIALAAAERTGVRVWGVEAEASPAISIAVEAGHVVEIEEEPTIADGLAGNVERGSVTVPLIARHVHRIVLEKEPMIREAMRFLAAEHGLVVEPSGAIGVAALMSGLIEPGDGTTVAVVSGRNVSQKLLVEILAGEP